MKITSSNGKFCEINTQYYKRYEVGWEHIPYAFEDICVRGWYLVSWNQATGLVSIGGVQKTKTVLFTLIFKTKHENKQFRRRACRVIKVPKQFLSTKPTVCSALARHRKATGHQSCLLTMQPLLLINGMRSAKRKESFRLKEERRDAHGEGDRPFRLQLLRGCEVG